jgi:hypothetical protein
VNGESIIMSISENDALWNNSTKQELAKKQKLINTIIKYKNETSVTISKEIELYTGTDYHVCINFVFKKLFLDRS